MQTVQTNRYGIYVFPNVINGTYKIDVSYPGFSFPERTVTVDGEIPPYINFSKAPDKKIDAYIPSVLTQGETSKIYWTKNWYSDKEYIQIKINNNNSGWKVLASGIPASKGFFNWRVNIPPTDNLHIKVSLQSDYRIADEKVVSVVAASGSSGGSGTKKVKHDFNGDGISDIFWRNDQGGNHIWLMRRDGSHRYFPKVRKPTDFKVAGIGDFNGDGRDDVLWRNGDGVSIWYMNPDGSHKYRRLVNKPSDFIVEGIGDFDGDGIADIFWKRGKGNYLWFMRKDGSHKYMRVVDKPESYVVAGVGDFNGDGRDDIFWKNNAGNSIWYMNPDGSHKYIGKVNKPDAYKVVSIGDFNHDGRDDVFWRKGSENGVWLMNRDGSHKWRPLKAKSKDYQAKPAYQYEVWQIKQVFWESFHS